MAAWEKDLLEGTAGTDILSHYHDAAVSSGQLNRARKLLDALTRQYPKNIQICSATIDICLRQSDFDAAMVLVEKLTAGSKPTNELLDAALAVRSRVAPLEVNPQDPFSISLCMIVRNESEMLAACLHGIKPLVDEIILVDTGSDDRTADIGRIFGAKVHAFGWCEDFAAARNFSVELAMGKWVLVLDADEAIAAQDFSTLRNIIRRAKNKGAFLIETRNYTHLANGVGWQANEGRYPHQEAGLGWIPSAKVRLFKHQPGVRFHFPVHERVEPSLRAAGIAVGSCPVPVHHYGHLNAPRTAEKGRRYYEMGLAKLNEMGDDLGAIRELAVQAGQLERWDEAIVLWQRLLKIQPDFTEALINLASAHWQMGRYNDSLTWAQKAVRQDGRQKEGHFNLAVSWLMLGDAGQAAAILESVTDVYPNHLASLFMLAASYAARGLGERAAVVWGKLRQSAAGPALGIAVEDLVQRLAQAGQTELARNVKIGLCAGQAPEA